jgi:dienelactone hydrolase
MQNLSFPGMKINLMLFLAWLPAVLSAQLPGLTINGNPQSANGASWTYQDSVNGTWYDLQGILFFPNAPPPYPAVIINHGTGGNANGYSRSMAQHMVQWGYACIGTNLCHASGVPVGSPGDTSLSNFGASENNILRAIKCWDILASLGDVDTNCIASFGHSRGAYTTTGLVATYPGKFSCAGHTAGGAIPQTGYSAPSTALAGQITCPYILHHGDSDFVVPVQFDSTLNSVFDSTGIIHDFFVYSGYSHQQMSFDTLMLSRTQNWFLNYTCRTLNASVELMDADVTISPNPGNGNVVISFPQGDACIEVISIEGKQLINKQIFNERELQIRDLQPGIYLARIRLAEQVICKKILVQ